MGNFVVSSLNQIQINGLEPKGAPQMLPRASTREVSILVKVTTKQILLTANCTAEDDEKCKQALTTLIAVQITPAAADKASGDEDTSKRVELSFKSGMGGGCNERPVGCVFDKEEIPDIKCPGYMIKIPGSVKEKDIACKYKCIKKVYKDADDCRGNCPLKCTEDYRCIEKEEDQE